MKELTKELMMEVEEEYKKYKLLTNEGKELTTHNRDMKASFMGRHFGEESDIEPSESKRIKKEVTKLINSIMEIDAGTEPLPTIKDVRASHLDFEDYIYEDLMVVFKQIVGNNEAKEDIKDQLETLYGELSSKLTLAPKIVSGILKTWYDTEVGKFPIILEVADNYRKIVRNLEE